MKRHGMAFYNLVNKGMSSDATDIYYVVAPNEMISEGHKVK